MTLADTAQSDPAAYRAALAPFAPRLHSGALVLLATGTDPTQLTLLRDGLSTAQIGDRPFDIGHRAMLLLKDLRDGKKLPADLAIPIDTCTPQNLATCPAR